jgi:hypothetical protein
MIVDAERLKSQHSDVKAEVGRLARAQAPLTARRMPVTGTIAKAKLRKRFEVSSSDNGSGACGMPRISKVKWYVPEVSSSSELQPEGSEGVSEGSGLGDEVSDGASLGLIGEVPSAG